MISVILPTYNEKDNIFELINQIKHVLRPYAYEIIVIDDNSPDQTAQILKDKNLAGVSVILRHKDKGLGSAIKEGLIQAKGTEVIVMDSDFQHEPKYLPLMIDALNNYEYVLASRFIKDGYAKNPIRHLLSGLANKFVRVVLKGHRTDYLFGFWAAKKTILEDLPNDKIFYGFGDYHIRLLNHLEKKRVRFHEFGAQHARRKSGQGQRYWIKIFWRYFISVLRTRAQHD